MHYTCFSEFTDADRFQKHGMDEFISANPCKLDHAVLFRILQRQTLDHRLNDSYSCLVSTSLSVCLVPYGLELKRFKSEKYLL